MDTHVVMFRWSRPLDERELHDIDAAYEDLRDIPGVLELRHGAALRSRELSPERNHFLTVQPSTLALDMEIGFIIAVVIVIFSVGAAVLGPNAGLTGAIASISAAVRGWTRRSASVDMSPAGRITAS